MQTNQQRAAGPRTHGGAPAFPKLTPVQQLRRAVLACMLWEDEFYEDGVSIAQRIRDVAANVALQTVADLACEARTKQHLRHAPLMLLRELAWRGSGKMVSDAIEHTIQRADELPELLALYWQDGKRPLSKQLKQGLAKAFRKFDAYALAKYNRERAVTLRDVMFMVHPKPKDDAQAAIWKHLADGTLQSPDTWEVALSGGADKRETFERLLREGKLGYLALLRNLRNMQEASVDPKLVRDAILARKGAQRVLPFRYLAAARACVQFEPALDEAMQAAIADLPKLTGTTVVLVDVSCSMDCKLSTRSDLSRTDAAASLAVLVNSDGKRVYSFSNKVKEVPARQGMAGIEAILKSQPHNGTDLAGAVRYINAHIPCDRLIVITDEQATTGAVPDPVAPLAYMINVASYQNGVGYRKWTHIDGFSENVIRYIHELESEFAVRLEAVAE